jgi:hypothetical protein
MAEFGRRIQPDLDARFSALCDQSTQHDDAVGTPGNANPSRHSITAPLSVTQRERQINVPGS